MCFYVFYENPSGAVIKPCQRSCFELAVDITALLTVETQP